MKNMWKLATLLTALFIILGIVGCSKQEEDSAMTVDALYEQGYTLDCSSYADQGPWKGYFVKDQNWEQPYLVEIPMTQEEVDEIYASASDEDTQKMICSKSDIKVTDMSDQVPAKDAFDKYIGKSLLDLEDDGYFVTGSVELEDGNVEVECSKTVEYRITLTFNEAVTFEQFDSGSVNHSDLTIKEIKFKGFSLD